MSGPPKNQHGGRNQSISNSVRLPPRSLRLQECPPLKVLECLLELLLGVHHDRSVPRDGFLKRFSREEEKPDPFVTRLHRNVVAPVKEYERAVLRLRGGG